MNAHISCYAITHLYCCIPYRKTGTEREGRNPISFTVWTRDASRTGCAKPCILLTPPLRTPLPSNSLQLTIPCPPQIVLICSINVQCLPAMSRHLGNFLVAVQLLTALLVVLCVLPLTRWRARTRGRPVPPGPRRMPIVGNLFNRPRSKQWLGYRNLSHKLGTQRGACIRA